MFLQSYFPFPVLNRKTIFLKKKSLYSLHLLFAITTIFVFNDGLFVFKDFVLTEGERNNLLEEMNPQ